MTDLSAEELVKVFEIGRGVKVGFFLHSSLKCTKQGAISTFFDCKSLKKRKTDQVDEKTIVSMMLEVDNDNDGSISFAEFVQVMVRHNRQRDAYEELVESFKIFLEAVEIDEDDDGVMDPQSRISGEMLCEVFKKVGMIDEGASSGAFFPSSVFLFQ